MSAGREPLEKGCAGTVVLVCASRGSAWCLLVGLIVAVCVCSWSPQWWQQLTPAPGAPVGSDLLTGSADREGTSYGSCPFAHAPLNSRALPLWWPRLLLSTPPVASFQRLRVSLTQPALVLSIHWERTQPPTPIPTNR